MLVVSCEALCGVLMSVCLMFKITFFYRDYVDSCLKSLLIYSEKHSGIMMLLLVRDLVNAEKSLMS